LTKAASYGKLVINRQLDRNASDKNSYSAN